MSNNLESTSMRDLLCASLRESDVGAKVSVCGWVAKRREHGEHLAFLDVRDHSGIVQAVVEGSVDVRSEYVVRVSGTVTRRPEGTVNEKLDTGSVELTDCVVEILASAEPVSSFSLTVPSGRRVTVPLTRTTYSLRTSTEPSTTAWTMPEWSRTSRNARCSPCSRRFATHPHTLTFAPTSLSRSDAHNRSRMLVDSRLFDMLSSSSVVQRPRRRPRLALPA